MVAVQDPHSWPQPRQGWGGRDPDATLQAPEIPVIDIGALGFTDEPDSGQAVAQAIGRACQEIGFFYVVNHGVPQDLREQVFVEAKRFFALPLEEKLKIPATRDHYRGYLALQSKGYANGKGDFFEGFKMQLDLGPEDPDVRAGKPLHAPNKWPENLPGFRETLLTYQAAMHELADRIAQGFALALGVDRYFFRPFFQKPLTQLSLMHYPPQPPETLGDYFGVHPHSDTGAFTILMQDETGGLEVGHRSGEWVSAPPIPDTYLINIGDMMARWTNDRFTSTPHRVINRANQNRISVPFFVNPDYDAVVECIPTCQSATVPARYPATHVGDYILGVYTSGWQGEEGFQKESTSLV
ncbi:MAG: 2-oxoglutarate and iron-dependent oxygenase domain-containing protein [Cyanobacteriota bacterium]